MLCRKPCTPITIAKRTSPGSPTGESDDVVSERVPGGLRDYDRTTHALVAIEVWDASTRLPRTLLEALPAPSAPHSAAM